MENAEKKSRQKWLAILFIISVTAGVYYNSLKLPFIFDDINKIVRNADIKQLGNLKTRLIYPYDENYHIPHRNDPSRPLVYLTYTLNYYFGQLNPFGYHLVNVLLHLLNSILIFLLARKFIFYAFGKNSVLLPFFTAVIFAVHTVNTSVVSYIFSRSDILSTFFYLLALLLFHPSSPPSPPRGEGYNTGKYSAGFFRNRLPYIFSLICFLLALGSKQSALTLPAVILSFDLIFNGKKGVFRNKFLHLPFWLILAAYLIARYYYFGALGDLEGMDALWDRYPYIMIQPYVIIRYLMFLLFPTGLCYYHFLDTPETLLEFKLLAPATALLCVFIFLLWISRKKSSASKLIVFSALWFFITISPTSSFFPTTTAMVENRLYLPEFGFIVLLVFGLFSLLLKLKYNPPQLNLLPGGEKARMRGEPASLLLLILLSAYIVLLCVMTVKRNLLYGDPAALWQEVIDKYPGNVRAYNSLGNYYFEQGEYDRAEGEYSNAIRIKPDYAEAHNNLGILYSIRKEYDSAILEYEITLKLDPGIAETHTNLGNLYSIKKKYDRAVSEYRKALEIDPNLAGAYYNIGISFESQGKYEEAMEAYQAVTKINPFYEGIQDKMANLKFKMNK